MSFTTGGQLLSNLHFHAQDAESAYLHDRIDDLESCLFCNTSLIQDIAKAPGQDSEGQLLFPAHCYQRLVDQQSRLKALVGKLATQAQAAKARESSFEHLTEEVKIQEVRHIRELANLVRESKATVASKELTVQELEQEHTTLEAERDFIASAQVSDVSRRLSVSQVKQLIKEVYREACEKERERDLLKGKCFVTAS